MYRSVFGLKHCLLAVFLLSNSSGCGSSTAPSKPVGAAYDSSAMSMQRSVKWDATFKLVALREQGWSDSDAEWAYNVSQGSQIAPYEWMLHLTTAEGGQRFLDKMKTYGYIPRSRTLDNEDGLCVGFCKEEGKDRTWFSMNCFACHTNIVEYPERKIAYLVDGAPALTDFQAFFVDLVAALDATLTNDDRFAEFSKSVLQGKDSEIERIKLKTDLKKLREIRGNWNARNMTGDTPAFGYGRLDAVGAILNEVTEHFLEIPENHRVCNAPVSYPFLWDTPHHDKVEWNGSAANTIFDLGNLARNTGEVLGVFGDLDIPKDPPLLGYSSSVKFDNLIEIEKKLKRLKSPLWPAEIPRNNDSKVLANGERHFKQFCASCHKFDKGDRNDDNRKIIAKMDDVGTDPTMAKNVRTRIAKTGRLFESRINFNPVGGVFEEESDGLSILVHTVIGTIAGSWKDAPPDQLERFKTKSLEEKAIHSKDLYKGRPLNGIWATGPFLHNGSVPTLRALLSPTNDRPKTFWVGGRKFDAKGVGFTSEKGVGSLFDTSLPGNSNAGHDGANYGTELKSQEIDDLLEYLKSL